MPLTSGLGRSGSASAKRGRPRESHTRLQAGARSPGLTATANPGTRARDGSRDDDADDEALEKMFARV